MTIAIVLSGGGSRGVFEVGALQYLYDKRIRPDILCGTSVGSINAAKLAEAPPTDPNQGAKTLRELVDIWLSLKDSSSMYLVNPWLEDSAHKVAAEILLERFKPSAGRDRSADFWPWDFVISWAYEDIMTLVTGEVAKQLMDFFENQKSLYYLEPLREQLSTHLSADKVKDSGVKLRLATVCLETGTLRYVTESGTILERDNQTPVWFDLKRIHMRSELPAKCHGILDEFEDAERELRDAGTELANARDNAEREAARREVAQAQAKVNEVLKRLEDASATNQRWFP